MNVLALAKLSNEEIVLCQEKISNEDFVQIQILSINSKCNISSELCKFRKYFFEHPPGKLWQARVVYFKFNMKQIEMRINQIKDWIYPQRRLTLQYDLQTLEKVAIVEWNR